MHGEAGSFPGHAAMGWSAWMGVCGDRRLELQRGHLPGLGLGQRILDDWLTRGREFIAHLLFGLSQATITSPALFAASRFLARDESTTEFLELAAADPVTLAIQLRRSRYEGGWGDQDGLKALVQNHAYEQFIRLEAFDFEPEAWEDDLWDLSFQLKSQPSMFVE
jgi:hypothetical protein